MHALIIEDDALIIFMIEDALREVGFTSCDTACSAAEAISTARRRPPNLITSDVQLVQGNGIEAVEAILREPVPVVFVTATANDVRERMRDAVVVQKPFGIANLKQAIVASLSTAPELTPACP